jgi:hypothetical protein
MRSERRRRELALAAVVLVAISTGCATAFTGSAYVEGGAAACTSKCKSAGMELAGMVFMGEYSDACVCVLPGQTASIKHQTVSAAAVAAGAAGVVMQTTNQQAAAAAAVQ